MFTKTFSRWPCAGDTITCEVEGVEYTARLEYDPDTHVDEFDCYGPDEIESWRNDEWWFGTLTLSARKGTVDLGDCLASIGGVDVRSNDAGEEYGIGEHLRDLANDLLPEAMAAVVDRVFEILDELGVE